MEGERGARGELRRGKMIGWRVKEKLCQEPTGREFQGNSRPD